MSEKTDQLTKDINQGRITLLQLTECVIRHYAQRKSLTIEAKRVLCGNLVEGGKGIGVIAQMFRSLTDISSEIIYNLDDD